MLHYAKYLPAGFFGVAALILLFLAATGDDEGAAMPSAVMILPAGFCGLAAAAFWLIAWML